MDKVHIEGNDYPVRSHKERGEVKSLWEGNKEVEKLVERVAEMVGLEKYGEVYKKYPHMQRKMRVVAQEIILIIQKEYTDEEDTELTKIAKSNAVGIGLISPDEKEKEKI